MLNQRRTLMVIAAVLLISSMLPAPIATRLAHPARAVVTLALSPFTAPLKSLSDSLRDRESTPTEVGSGEDMTTQLAQAVVVIEQLDQELQAAQQQIALLTQTDEIAMEGTRRIMARVASYSGNTVRPTITIDRGALKGIATDAPVVHGVNLIGLVERVYPTAADVELITAAGTRFQVRIRPPRVDSSGREVSEMIELSDDRSHFHVQLEQKEPVEVGDWVHLADSRWPPEAQGWVVGKVTQIRDDPENKFLFKRVIIHPMEPLGALNRVTVVVPVE